MPEQLSNQTEKTAYLNWPNGIDTVYGSPVRSSDGFSSFCCSRLSRSFRICL